MRKNYSLSLIRILALFLVIFCHIFELTSYSILGNYLAVGVQLFLPLSGYLYSHKEFEDSKSRIKFVFKNCYKILVDYYICVIIFIVVYYFVQPECINLRSIWDILLCKSAWFGIHHLWYIPYCLMCYLITPLLYDLKKYLKSGGGNILSGFLIFIIAFEILLYTYNSYFMPMRIISYIIGYFLPEIKSFKKLFVLWNISVFIAIVLNIIRYKYMYVWTPEAFTGIKSEVLEFLYNYANLFLGLSLFLTIVIFLRNVDWPVWTQHIFDKTDILSYDFYLVHMIFVKGCLSLIGKLGSFIVEVLAILIVTFISGILLHLCSNFVKKLISKTYCKSQVIK